ncbi:MAG: peptidylprolyl isomerase [Boseongicola sp.]|nr:MAG: peptidylprolyl isomerase [Boseongicola sp.]
MAKKKAGNIFLWIIMVLLIAGLAGFGATNFGGSARAVATVGEVEIDVNDYARAVQAQTQNFQRQTGQALTPDQLQMLGLDRAALAQSISDAAINNLTLEAGISVGDETISQEITQNPAFFGLSGSFDRETYQFALRQTGLTVAEFEEQLRMNGSSQIVRAAVVGGIRPPALFTETLFNYARETRDVTWVRMTGSDLAEPLPEPSDTELRQFHTDNAELFTQGETRVIDYAWLTPDMILDAIDVDETQLRSVYDSRRDQYAQPERRLVERLVISTQAEADDAKARLDAGEITFDALVAERGLTLADIDMGEPALEELGDAGDAVFALTEPGVVGPLPSPFGPALYRMNAILSARETSFEDARDELAEEAARDRARRIIIESLAQVDDLLAGGATVDILEERTDMQAGRIEWRSDVSDGIAGYNEFRLAAANAEVGAFLDVQQFEDGGIFVVSLDEIRPPALRPFDEVRHLVIPEWERANTEAALSKQAQDMANGINSSADFAALGLDVETDLGLERSGFVEGTPADFTDTVFDMSGGDLRVLSADGDAWLLRLDAVNAADANTPDAQVAMEQFESQTSAEMAQSLLQAFTQAVLNDTDVSINQAAVNAVNSLGAGGGGQF